MIYNKLSFQVENLHYSLDFPTKITVLGGDSGTGKTLLYKHLQMLKVYKGLQIRLFNIFSDNLKENIEQCRSSLIVIDNGDLLLSDDLKAIINRDSSNQYLILIRDVEGLDVSAYSFKILERKDNCIRFKGEFDEVFSMD